MNLTSERRSGRQNRRSLIGAWKAHQLLVRLSLPVFAISRFTNKTGSSYGIYLYALPIQSMIAFFTHRAINPWLLSAASLALAAAGA
jgi:hypothetical protein